MNTIEDGSSIRMSDGGASQIAWDLTYSGLSTDEWNAIEQLFEATQGQLGTFTFLDPISNLLRWSEDYSKPVWTLDPLLQLGAGVADPFGGTTATRLTNTAQASQRLMQQVSGPAWYQYCFSGYLRSGSPEGISLLQTSASGLRTQAYTTGPQWARFSLSARLPATDDGIEFGIELAAGSQLDVFGFQVEPQPGTGKYKKTIDMSGVFVNCRFAEDTLTVSTEALNRHSAVVRLVSNVPA